MITTGVRSHSGQMVRWGDGCIMLVTPKVWGPLSLRLLWRGLRVGLGEALHRLHVPFRDRAGSISASQLVVASGLRSQGVREGSWKDTEEQLRAGLTAAGSEKSQDSAKGKSPLQQRAGTSE